MEITEEMPCLEGKIYIDPPAERTACYAPQKWHNKLNKTIKDIKLYSTKKDTITEKVKQPHPTSYIFIPLIPVWVFIYEGKSGHNWTLGAETPTISRFKQTKELTEFPKYIPITWLHKAKNDTKLSLTVHAFNTTLTCSACSYTRIPFEKELNLHINSIKENAPSYLWYNEEHKQFVVKIEKDISYIESAFIEQKLLKKSENDGTKYEYGDKPFTCIEKLFIFNRLQDVLPMQIILLLLKNEYN